MAFRPHVFNYNFLRDCAEKEALFSKEAKNPSAYPEDAFFDFEERIFDPLHSFHKEYIYPYPVIYVTTYALTFFPHKPDDLEKLQAVLKKAFQILETVEQRFGNPIHYSSATAYERPDPEWIIVKDKEIEIQERVDLDDLYNLFYLLEDCIVASSSIAQTLSAAGLVEARSSIKTHDDLGCGHDYSIDNSPKIDQMGTIHEHSSAPLEQTLKDLFRLYALGKIDEKGFVKQSMNMADMVLMGQITNQTQTLLSYNGIKQEAESEGRSVVPYDVALTELTKAFIKTMAGIPPDVPVASLGNLVFQAVAQNRDAIIAELQANDLRDANAATNRVLGRVSSGGIDMIANKISQFMEEQAKAISISDALSGYNPNYYDDKEDDFANAITISSANRLIVRDPDIEPSIARNYDRTPYTSRMSGDPFPRIEMPAYLAKFLRPENRPAAERALLTFSLK